MENKRLLFINGHLNAGGCERSLVDLLRNLDYSCSQVDLLLLEEEGDYLKELPEEVNVILYSLNRSYGPFVEIMFGAFLRRDWFSFFFRLVNLLSHYFGRKWLCFSKPLFKKLDLNYDAIIAYRPGICTELAAYTFMADVKISWWHHGAFEYTQQQTSELEKCYHAMDTVVTVSENCAELLYDHLSYLRGKITIIPNMICVDELEKKACVELGFSSRDVWTLVTVGRMDPEKNMLLCPEIGKILEAKGINYHWIMIGDGAEYTQVKNRIYELNLSDMFILTGRIDNPYPLIKSADILFHPSTVESQGLTILEAMALGTPAIAVNSLGPCEYVKNNVNGCLIEPTAEAAAESIIHLLQDDKLRESIVIEGKKTVNQFSPANTIERFEKLVNSKCRDL